MYSEEDLESAVSAGALSADAAEAFRRHVAQKTRTPVVDEEHFRLITGFNDVFVVIAVLLLLAAMGWIGGSQRYWLGGAGCAVASWLLAEFFVRQRRMALPAIVLLLGFVGGVFAACVGLLGGTLMSALRDGGYAIAAAAGLAALASWIHWRRFQVPITVAAGACAIAGTAVVALLSATPRPADKLLPLIFVCGLAMFGYAMYWDASDPARQTRRSDVAFWLHLAAAPMMVHPIFSQLGMLDSLVTPVRALLVTVLYLAIGLISLCIDRRALMVSALGYVLYIFTDLLRQNGFVSLGFAITALVIGSALLLLSAFWQGARTRVLPRLPAAWQSRLAPLR